MSTQLAKLVEACGPTISLKGKAYQVSQLSKDGVVAVARFSTPRTSYLGVLCPKVTVTDRPGAEVWSIMSNSGGRTLAWFAVHEGEAHALHS